MKKFVITTVLALAPFFTFAQSAFDKFNDVEGIEAVDISGSMFDMIGDLVKKEAGSEADKLKDQIKNIKSLKLYTTTVKKYKKQLRETADEYLKTNKLEQLMSINEEGSKIKIYVKQDAATSIISEGLVFIDDAEDKELMVFSFTGSLDLAALTESKK
ncbi:hypothetical protein AM493_08650 [Flavobacterium akiainvivens]|uniref:DUF4252 domain-containing protein n=1 Tax=Flavobacterium akiainvivens TaxID=1202724 RepID=A0A0N0RQR1_9FLAO|nr:DUF4252 domain-containing protein [Flavobacterium akiainvivens]KOS06099.1 hypothetical protein AM493_08650 [Flavobacterium akiainvivens]SFQ54918.1 protein of unknown function [Flavobacterium akiainvivens]